MKRLSSGYSARIWERRSKAYSLPMLPRRSRSSFRSGEKGIYGIEYRNSSPGILSNNTDRTPTALARDPVSASPHIEHQLTGEMPAFAHLVRFRRLTELVVRDRRRLNRAHAHQIDHAVEVRAVAADVGLQRLDVGAGDAFGAR